MSLYRLDRADGRRVLDNLGRDFLTRNAACARAMARKLRDTDNVDVTVTRIYGAGLTKQHYVAQAT